MTSLFPSAFRTHPLDPSDPFHSFHRNSDMDIDGASSGQGLFGNGLLGGLGSNAIDEPELEGNGLLGGMNMDMDVGGDVDMEAAADDSRGTEEQEEGLMGNGLLGMTGSSNEDQDVLSRTSSPQRTPSPSPPPSLQLPATRLFQPYDDSVLRAAQALRMPSFQATTSTGESVSFERQLRARGDVRMPQPSPGEGSSTGKVKLLETPFHTLRKQNDEDASERLARRLEAENKARVAAAKGKGKANKDEGGKKAMWVDKYRPSKFTDLLGEERSHRDVLSWLKEWDKCVFKFVAPGVTIKKRKMMEGADPEFVYHDALGRPKERILLMSGPPGLGKTTLAHVVAKQAGYDVLEINASDDRSASTVTERIQNAIDAGSGLRSKGKPTCVIIDEIDGAAGGGEQSFIKSLLKLIQDVPANKRKKQAAKVLKRPIICICNDVYATALRPLRPMARIVRFTKAQPGRVVNRLRDICEREGLQCDSRGLATLVELTGADVRSCLNTLQFIKSRSDIVTEKSIRTTAVGMKDGGTSLQTVWNALLVPVSTKKHRQNGAKIEEGGRFVGRLAEVVISAGEMDKVMSGCFEHYPHLKPTDTSLKNLTRLHDWIHHYDIMHHRIQAYQDYELMAYVPYAIVPWYKHMAAPANLGKAVEFPKADYESFVKTTATKEIGLALMQSIPPTIRSIYNATNILTELGPYLMRIITPPLKPVNADLVKPEEKATLKRLVEVMIDLGLRFYRDKNEEGMAVFRLEPEIDALIHYDGKRASDIGASRFAVRSLVSQAIDAELARRRAAVGKGDGAVRAAGGKEIHSMFKSKKPEEAPTAEIKEKAAVDFFGRIKTALPTSSGSTHSNSNGHTDGPPAKKFRLIYRFNEGSSSAVRKPVKMGEML